MCHTCIQNNNDFCSDCLTKQKRFSSSYQEKNEIIKALVSTLIISSIIALLLFNTKYNLPDYPLTKNLLITFFVTLSIVYSYFMLKETEIIQSVGKIPFIGFKLSIILYILIVMTGLPILYMIYKSLLILKTNYLKKS